MMKSATAGILLIAWAPGAIAWAQSAASPTQETLASRESSAQTANYADAHYQAAFSFAKTLKSEGAILAESRYAFNGELAKDLQSNPDIAAMEADYPGITQYLMLELRSEIEKQVTDSMPTLWNSLAKLFAEAMNEKQLAEASAYYSSASGQRLIAATFENTDYSGLGKAIVDNPEGNITGNDLTNSVRAGVGKTLAAMSADDKSVLMAFMKTEAFGKVRELGPKVQAVSAEWANDSSPENEQRIEKIAGQAVEAFIEKAEVRDGGK